MDLAATPLSYADASMVQLFWRANWYHDRVYKYGFTEPAGNFQATNFNKGGKGNDAVIALVQCGADIGYEDNATFTPLPDGYPGVCRMFVFNGPQPSRDGSMDQEVVVHELVTRVIQPAPWRRHHDPSVAAPRYGRGMVRFLLPGFAE